MAFAEPLAFVFAALLGVLVLLHLWEQRRPRVIVPSLLLWANLTEERLTSSKFRPDILFFLRALILALLIVGLARPYWMGPEVPISGTRHILVLDTTASMQARERGGSRFELARQQVSSYIDHLPVEDEVMLLAAGRTSTVLSESTRDRSVLREALARTAPIDVGGDLAAAVALADAARQRGDVPSEIVAFTDTPRSQLPASVRDRVTVFQIGSTDENVAIASLQIHQGRFQDFSGAQAQFEVRNFSARETHGMVTIQVEDSIVERNGFSLQPLEARSFLVRGFPRAGRVLVRLEQSDALALDNVAYGWIRDVRPTRVLVVSKVTSLARDLRQLAPAARLRLSVIEPSTFRPESAANTDLVVFHRVTPEAPDGVNALYIYPPADSSLFPGVGEAKRLELIDWNADHPALRAVKPLSIGALGRARIVTPPAGSDVLIASRTTDHEVPLAFTYERGTQRLACLSFDLEGERILQGDNLNLLLLLLGLIDWLSPQGDEVQVARTGEAVNLGVASTTLRVVDPQGRSVAVDPNSSILEPQVAGVYAIESDGAKRSLLANFADPQESNIGIPQEPERPRVQPTPETAPERGRAPHATPQRDFSPWLWLAALLLFVGEWIVAGRTGEGTR